MILFKASSNLAKIKIEHKNDNDPLIKDSCQIRFGNGTDCCESLLVKHQLCSMVSPIWVNPLTNSKRN